MKISLVNPRIPDYRRNHTLRQPRHWQPLAMAIVARWLEQHEFDIQFIDALVMDLDDAETARLVHGFAPDILYYSSERTDAWELPIPDTGYIEAFFRAYTATGAPKPHHVLLEGPHGSTFPDDLLRRLPLVDACLRGESEPVSFRALDALRRGRSLAGVTSVSWRRADGQIVHEPDDPNPLKYRDFPTPAWHLLPMDRYRDRKAPDIPFAMVQTSRGCPLPCGYCYKQMFGDRQSKREPTQVVAEIAELVDRYGVRRLQFQDQIFTLDRRHAQAVCEGLIARGLADRIEWRCQTRLPGLQPELLQWMRAAGCVEIHTGLETGSEEMQRSISKLTLAEFQHLRRVGEDLGITITPNVMIGLPGETWESALESIRFFHRLGITIEPNVNLTQPMTPYFKEARERGELRVGDWDEVIDKAGLIGNHLDRPTLDRIQNRIARRNAWLRVKRRLWRTFGRDHRRAATPPADPPHPIAQDRANPADRRDA